LSIEAIVAEQELGRAEGLVGCAQAKEVVECFGQVERLLGSCQLVGCGELFDELHLLGRGGRMKRSSRCTLQVQVRTDPSLVLE